MPLYSSHDDDSENIHMRDHVIQNWLLDLVHENTEISSVKNSS